MAGENNALGPYPLRGVQREDRVIAVSLLLGSTGAVPTATLAAAKKAGFSIARNSAGNYTVTFGRKWKQLKCFNVQPVQAISATAGMLCVETTAYSASAGTFTFTLQNMSGAAADAANAATLRFMAVVSQQAQEV